MGELVSELKEKAEAVFVSNNEDLKATRESLTRHRKALKEHDKGLERVFNLVATLEGRLQAVETKVKDLEDKLFIVRNCHDDLATKVGQQEAEINYLQGRLCRCVDRLTGTLQVRSKDEEDDDEDALTYATDNSYRTPPQEASSSAGVLQPVDVEVKETATCSCPAPVPIAQDVIDVLDTEEEAEVEKENEVPLLVLPTPRTPPQMLAKAVCFQRAICSGRKTNCPHPYPSITFPTIGYPGLSVMCEICRSYWEAHRTGKIETLHSRY